MKLARLSGLVAGFTLLALLGGCAPTKSVDYSAFKQAKPRSILVLPPLNESPDVKATYSMLSQVTFPLAEAGYYVVPVALADETFRQNGLTSAGDVHQVSPAKLREIYGADAALYVTVSDYGTRYMVISSATIVTASAKLVDLRSGTTPVDRLGDRLQRGRQRRQQRRPGGHADHRGGQADHQQFGGGRRLSDRRDDQCAPALGRPAGRTVVRPALAEVRQRLSRAPGLRGRFRGLGASRREGLGRCVALGHVLADQVVEQRPDGAPLVQPQAADGLELQAQVFR